MVWFSKHLCGNATDLTLRCAKNYILNSKNENSINKNPIESIVIATCCHNRCTWTDFVGL